VSRYHSATGGRGNAGSGRGRRRRGRGRGCWRSRVARRSRRRRVAGVRHAGEEPSVEVCVEEVELRYVRRVVNRKMGRENHRKPRQEPSLMGRGSRGHLPVICVKSKSENDLVGLGTHKGRL